MIPMINNGTGVPGIDDKTPNKHISSPKKNSPDIKSFFLPNFPSKGIEHMLAIMKTIPIIRVYNRDINVPRFILSKIEVE